MHGIYQTDCTLNLLCSRPHSHRTRGYTHARSPSLERWNPLSRKKIYPLYISCIGYHLAITKKHPLFLVFSGSLPETTANKYPLSREIGNAHAAPSCIRVGAGARLCYTYTYNFQNRFKTCFFCLCQNVVLYMYSNINMK